MKKPPNVILIITDDQGYGDLACHGNPTIKTTNIDSLYGDNVCLTNYHVKSSCIPARAGLLAGRYFNNTGLWHTIGSHSLLHIIRKNQQSPYFCYLNTNAPRSLFQVSEKYITEYDGQVPESRVKFYISLGNRIFEQIIYDYLSLENHPEYFPEIDKEL